MRVFILILLLGLSLADEATSLCERKCGEQYTNEVENTACKHGCTLRSQSMNPFAFLGCFSGCDKAFSNSTEERDACRFACQLPRRSSVMMTLVKDDDGNKKWKVVEQTDDEKPVVRYSNDDPLSAILFRGQPRLSSNSDSSEEDSDEPQKDIFAHMRQMQSRMDEMFKAISKQFTEQLTRQSADDSSVALERPAGHDPWAGGSFVGNTAENGESIIETDSDDDDDDEEPQRRGFVVELRRPQQPRIATILPWILIAIGFAALLTAICAVAAFVRSLRNGTYRRVGGNRQQIPVFMHVQAGPLPEKKVPLEGWAEQKPTGVPPPAYDQVSIHKAQEAEEATEATSPK